MRPLGNTTNRVLAGALLQALLVVTAVAGPAGAQEASTFVDEFAGGSLGAGWLVTDRYAEDHPGDPTNHATVGVTGDHLSIAFPDTGTDHNQWTLEHAQVTRAYEGSGVYEIKVDSAIDGDQQFGLVFEGANAGTFMMFMIYSAADQLWAYSERFASHSGVQHKTTTTAHYVDLDEPDSGPYWLRVTVADDADPTLRGWKFEFSVDGNSWATLADGPLEQAGVGANVGVLQRVGVFAGNQRPDFSGFDARFDYFQAHPVSATPLRPPTRLLASPGDGRVALAWDAVVGATGYDVERSIAGGPWSSVATSTDALHVDTGLGNGVLHRYRVTALAGSDSRGPSPPASAVPHPLPGLGPVPTSGLVLALRADDLLHLLGDGDAITQWGHALGDPAGGTQHPGRAPTLLTNALNGHALARFSGKNSSLSLASGYADLTGGLTLVVVARPSDALSEFKLLSLGNPGGTDAVILGRQSADGSMQYFTTNGSGGGTGFDSGSAWVAGEAAVLSITQPGGAPGQSVTAEAHKDSGFIGSGYGRVPPSVLREQNSLGSSFWLDERFEGEVAEVLLWDRPLSPSERDAVHTHLYAKYDLGNQEPPPPPPPPPLDPPSASASPGDGSASLSWGGVPGATGYRVLNATNPGGPYQQVHDGSGTGFTHAALPNGVTHYYVVRAYNAQTESADSLEIAVTPQAALPAPPTLTVPSEIPSAGLRLLLDAENATLEFADGDPVVIWRDASGLGHDATPPAGGEPMLATSALNGRATLGFDGVDDYLTLPVDFDDFTAGVSLFIIARPTVLQDGFKMLVLGNGAGQENLVLGRRNLTPALQYFTNDSAGGVEWFFTGDTLVAGEAALFSVIQDPGAADALTSATVSKNGTAIGTGDVYVPPVASRGSNYLGRSYWADGLFQGELAEVILYDRKLTRAEEDDVRAYLEAKYDLGIVPTDAPPPPAPPDPPTGLVATSGDAVVFLGWSAAAGATGYRVHRSGSAGGPYAEIADVATTSHTDTTVANGFAYYYVVTAYSADGESFDSIEVSATPEPPPPPVELPDDVPADGLVLLLDAEDAAAQFGAGNPATTWIDASGAGMDGTAPPGGAPLAVPGAIGGRAALRFDGVDDFYSLPTNFEDFTGGVSLFVVARPTFPNDSFKILALGNGAGLENLVLGRAQTTAGFQYFTNSSTGGVQYFNTASGLVDGEAALFSVIQGGGAPDADVTATVSRNGTAVGSGTVYVPPLGPRAQNYVGNSYWAEATFQGDIAEVILYERELTLPEQNSLLGYLQAKYGLALEIPLVPPSGLVATPGDGSVTIGWDAVAGATGYRVWRSTSAGGPHVEIASVTAPGHVDADVVNGAAYFYAVSSMDDEGGESAVSAESSPAIPQAGGSGGSPSQVPLDESLFLVGGGLAYGWLGRRRRRS